MDFPAHPSLVQINLNVPGVTDLFVVSIVEANRD
jgi:hypothetical protein